MKIFVYGTLRRGSYNHYLLEDSPFIGNGRTVNGFTMVNMGGFPGVISGGDTSIVGELYEVNKETLAQLDRLEGHPDWYTRTPITITDEAGKEHAAELYLLPAFYLKNQHIETGDWMNRRAKAATGGL